MGTRSILVTGSSGMIGTALCDTLLDRGFEVTGADTRPNQWSDSVDDVTIQVDLLETESIDVLPSDVDIVVHLAANARVHKLVEDPTGARDNLQMTFNALEYARQSDISALIFGSSREVYGNKGKVIYSEEDTYVDECESPYTASKVGGEALAKAYDQCYNLDTAILRFSNVYGRYDVSDRVIPLFINLAMNNEDLTVYGEDKVLDFTYIDDCIDGLVRTITNFHKSKGTTFNIASGQGSSLIELAETIIDHLDADSSIHIEPNRPGEVSRYVADISKANQVLNYEPRYTLSEGIEETLEWYQTMLE